MLMSMCVLEKVFQLSVRGGLSRLFVRYLAKNTLGHQMKMIQQRCLMLLNIVDFLKCLVVSTTCIGSGKIVPYTGLWTIADSRGDMAF
jgi:hypothetical protein